MAKQAYTATLDGQELVKQAIAYKGWTQQQIAERANLKTRSSISKLINGKSVERQIFQRICACLEVDFRAIAGLQPPADRNPSEQPVAAPVHALAKGFQVSSQDGSSQSSFKLNIPLPSQALEPTVEPAAALIGDGFSAEPGYKSAPQSPILEGVEKPGSPSSGGWGESSKVQSPTFDDYIQQLEELLQGGELEVDKQQNMSVSTLLSLMTGLAEKTRQILNSELKFIEKNRSQRHLRSSPERRALPPGQDKSGG